MQYAEVVKFLVAMIIMMNPLGSLSIFLQLTHRSPTFYQQQTALKCGLAISIILILTILIGKDLLDLLGISIASFRFAGGIILLLMGLSLLQSQESPMQQASDEDVTAIKGESIAIVPMALPIIIGPGCITTLILAANDYTSIMHKFYLCLLCLLLSVGMTSILYFGHSLVRLVGVSVMKVISRIMGMIIMAIAAGMLANGLMGMIPALSA